MDIERGLKLEMGRAQELIKSARTARVYCHRDADGLCGAAIIRHLLNNLGFESTVSAYLPDELAKLNPAEGLNIFVDVGSGQLTELSRRFKHMDTLVLDHHPPQGRAWRGLVQVNPHRFNLDGSTEISGSGLAYLLCKSIIGEKEMSKIALVGAIADRQDLLGKLEGLNVGILSDAVGMGLVTEEKDVLLFGRESRPLHIALKSFQDPPIPGVSGLEGGSLQLLSDLHIPLRDGDGFRTLGDLTMDERRRLASELVVRCITRTSPRVAKYVPMLIIGSVYRMIGENPPLQYASEFATCINSAARMGHVHEAIEMMLRNRVDHYKRVLSGLREYRGMLSKEIQKVTVRGVELGGKGYLQYFFAEGTPRNLIGPVTGIVLGGGMADPYKPLVGLVPGQNTKASVRCSKILVLEGLDLSISMRHAAVKVGGEGGGHKGAAGAFFINGRESEFVRILESHLLSQTRLKRSRSVP